MKCYTVGIDIGGTKCAVLLGRILSSYEKPEDLLADKISFETQVRRGPQFVIGNICDAIEQILDRNNVSVSEILSIGISCGGPLDQVRGIIKNPPNLYGWDNIPIVQILEERFHVPAFLENDANACALAEWHFGAAKGLHNVIFLTFGTGMGAGLILNNQLYNGSINMAGEVGHIRMAEFGPAGFGKSGSFEGFCSGAGIAQIARTKVTEQLQMGNRPSFCPDFDSLDQLSAKTVAVAAEKGDALAQEIYKICGYYLGKGMAILIDILNPDMLVLGSIYERSKELLWPSAKCSLSAEALKCSLEHCQIVPSMLGNQIGDIAALSIALNSTHKMEK